MMKPSYLEVLAKYFPGTRVRANNAGALYGDLVHDGGDPLPTKSDLDLLVVQDTRENVWRLIQAERDRRTQGGVRVGTNWFHSDASSRIQQLGLVMFGANLPPGIMWKTLGGSFVEMTPTLAVQIFQTTAVHDQQVFAVAEQRRAIMNSMADPENYDHLSGSPTWPATFGE